MTIVIVQENVFAAIAAAHQVVEGARKFDSKLAGHGRKNAGRNLRASIKYYNTRDRPLHVLCGKKSCLDSRRGTRILRFSEERTQGAFIARDSLRRDAEVTPAPPFQVMASPRRKPHTIEEQRRSHYWRVGSAPTPTWMARPAQPGSTEQARQSPPSGSRARARAALLFDTFSCSQLCRQRSESIRFEFQGQPQLWVAPAVTVAPNLCGSLREAPSKGYIFGRRAKELRLSPVGKLPSSLRCPPQGTRACQLQWTLASLHASC